MAVVSGSGGDNAVIRSGMVNGWWWTGVCALMNDDQDNSEVPFDLHEFEILLVPPSARSSNTAINPEPTRTRTRPARQSR